METPEATATRLACLFVRALWDFVKLHALREGDAYPDECRHATELLYDCTQMHASTKTDLVASFLYRNRDMIRTPYEDNTWYKTVTDGSDMEVAFHTLLAALPKQDKEAMDWVAYTFLGGGAPGIPYPT